MQARALFLDRDGVVNVDHGYVHDIQNFQFMDGIFDLVRAAVAEQYKIIIITNQAGIARGFYSEAQFEALTIWMCEQFASQGVSVDKVYFSPYHPTEGVGIYKKDDISRKPRPGMILQAKKEFNLDLAASILIGDKVTDIQAGIAAGVGQNILFSSAEPEPEDLRGVDYQKVSELAGALRFLAHSRVKQATQ